MVPRGMFLIGSAFPGRMSAWGPDIRVWPTATPRGAMM